MKQLSIVEQCRAFNATNAPTEKTFIDLAVNRGWATRMAPLRKAGDVLGRSTPEVAEATGLDHDCEVLCGLHDSNAALLAARGYVEIATSDATVLSTGTWFIGMRSIAADSVVDISSLQGSRYCLVNVDIYGRPTPSARVMGGREVKLIAGIDSFALPNSIDPDEFLARLPDLIERYHCPNPSYVSGVGPFPNAIGEWPDRPQDLVDQRVLTHRYLALMVHTALDLIRSRDRLLVEGRFAEDEVFVGALRLVSPELNSSSALTPVAPLDLDLDAFAASWRRIAELSLEAA